MGRSTRLPIRWVPETKVMVPISGGTSSSAIHIVTVPAEPSGQ
jgi:hypothetical protein